MLLTTARTVPRQLVQRQLVQRQLVHRNKSRINEKTLEKWKLDEGFYSACKVLSFYLHDTSFARAFIQNSTVCIENLKQLASECSAGERMPVTEVKCEKLLLLYIDCAKPPPPPSKTIAKPTAPEMFPCEKFPVSETKICTDVHFTSMSFLVISCRSNPKAIKKECACIDRSQAQQMSSQWTLEMDTSLVQLVNHLCHRLSISPFAIHPHEIYVEEGEANAVRYRLLQEVPVESTRLRFALIQSLNETLSTFFLPLVDLRPSLGRLLTLSIASLVSDASGLVFYDTTMEFVNEILNSTALRKADQPAPEVVLNPLDSIQLQYERRRAMETYVSQALKQLSVISSTQLCVPLAKRGDPMYAFNVRFVGEEVQGTSGSFRHFLWHVAKELEHGNLNVLTPSPSNLGYKSCGKYLLSSDPLTFSEEKILQFCGQLLGVAIRAGIPFGLDLATVFWKNLVRIDLDPVTDLKDADPVTYSYIKKIEMAESKEELVAVCNEQMPFFVYSSLEGEEVELIRDGKKIQLSWENRDEYVDCVRSLRMTELRCVERMVAIKSGLASVVPLQLLMLMTPYDAEFKTCGLPEVNLEFLKMHTIYQVGLTESDHHIQFFWNVLESFSQEEICRFIKFACNQERIPQICPCQNHGSDAAHVPPYPMKIAPPDGSGENADSRYIRTETCMFMVKLPQYSTQELMRESLLYSIHYREDPLSG